MRLMASSEATGDACRLYLAWATYKLPQMAQNLPGTPTKIGISSDQKAEKLDRRISVAPVFNLPDILP